MERYVDAHSRHAGVHCAQQGHLSAALATHQASRKPLCANLTHGSSKSRRTPGTSYKAVSTDIKREVKLQDLRSNSWEPAQRQERQRLQVREARHAEEFREVGWLRARAYFENKAPVRYQGSFTKQFAEQEARSLVGRTQPSKSCPMPEAVCLIVTRPEQTEDQAVNSMDIVATADIKPPASAGGKHPQEIPQDNAGGNEGAYIQNVVVCTRFRRTGCGKAIMTSAEEYARRLWGAKRAYVQVSSLNEPAQKLYLKLGYKTHSLLSRGFMLLYKDL